MNLDLIQVTPMVDLTLITSCYLCDSSDLKIIFSTNNICLTGFFPKKDDPDPLATQLPWSVAPTVITFKWLSG